MTLQERIDSGWIIDSYKEGWREGTVDEFINDFPIFKNYFEQICGSFNGNSSPLVAILKSTRDNKWYKLIFYTEKHEYFITVRNNWICGECSNRYYEPLENWTRGHDLGDGDCTEETLIKILYSILGHELIKYDNGKKMSNLFSES